MEKIIILRQRFWDNVKDSQLGSRPSPGGGVGIGGEKEGEEFTFWRQTFWDNVKVADPPQCLPK